LELACGLGLGLSERGQRGFGFDLGFGELIHGATELLGVVFGFDLCFGERGHRLFQAANLAGVLAEVVFCVHEAVTNLYFS